MAIHSGAVVVPRRGRVRAREQVMVVLVDRSVVRWDPVRPFRHRDPTSRQVDQAVNALVHGDPAAQMEVLFNLLYYHPSMFNAVALEVRRYNLGTQALQRRGH